MWPERKWALGATWYFFLLNSMQSSKRVLQHYFGCSFGTRLKRGTMKTRLKTGENSITDQSGFCIHFKTSESTACTRACTSLVWQLNRYFPGHRKRNLFFSSDNPHKKEQSIKISSSYGNGYILSKITRRLLKCNYIDSQKRISH